MKSSKILKESCVQIEEKQNILKNNLVKQASNVINKKEVKKQTYSQVKLLGEGSYGKAFLVKCSSDNSYAVIKTLSLNSMTEEAKKEAYKEAKILEKLDHSNIIRFIEVFRSNRPYPTLNIVMEYADGGDLNKLIKLQQKEKSYFPEDKILDWFCQICLAVKHLHDKKVLHRDLKSGNIFLTKGGLVKLGDFGISKNLDNTMDKAKTVIGTPYYLSPEIIMNKPYSFQSDIWSLGVLLYEICLLKMPFDAKSMPMLTLKIIKGEYTNLPDVFSKDIRDIIKWILVVDPKKRPKIDDLLKSNIIRRRIKSFLNDVHFNQETSESIIKNYKILKEKNEKKLSENTDMFKLNNNLVIKQPNLDNLIIKETKYSISRNTSDILSTKRISNNPIKNLNIQKSQNGVYLSTDSYSTKVNTGTKKSDQLDKQFCSQDNLNNAPSNNLNNKNIINNQTNVCNTDAVKNNGIKGTSDNKQIKFFNVNNYVECNSDRKNLKENKFTNNLKYKRVSSSKPIRNKDYGTEIKTIEITLNINENNTENSFSKNKQISKLASKNYLVSQDSNILNSSKITDCSNVDYYFDERSEIFNINNQSFITNNKDSDNINNKSNRDISILNNQENKIKDIANEDVKDFLIKNSKKLLNVKKSSSESPNKLTKTKFIKKKSEDIFSEYKDFSNKEENKDIINNFTKLNINSNNNNVVNSGSNNKFANLRNYKQKHKNKQLSQYSIDISYSNIDNSNSYNNINYNNKSCVSYNNMNDELLRKGNRLSSNISYFNYKNERMQSINTNKDNCSAYNNNNCSVLNESAITDLNESNIIDSKKFNELKVCKDAHQMLLEYELLMKSYKGISNDNLNTVTSNKYKVNNYMRMNSNIMKKSVSNVSEDNNFALINSSSNINTIDEVNKDNENISRNSLNNKDSLNDSLDDNYPKEKKLSNFNKMSMLNENFDGNNNQNCSINIISNKPSPDILENMKSKNCHISNTERIINECNIKLESDNIENNSVIEKDLNDNTGITFNINVLHCDNDNKSINTKTNSKKNAEFNEHDLSKNKIPDSLSSTNFINKPNNINNPSKGINNINTHINENNTKLSTCNSFKTANFNCNSVSNTNKNSNIQTRYPSIANTNNNTLKNLIKTEDSKYKENINSNKKEEKNIFNKQVIESIKLLNITTTTNNNNNNSNILEDTNNNINKTDPVNDEFSNVSFKKICNINKSKTDKNLNYNTEENNVLSNKQFKKREKKPKKKVILKSEAITTKDPSFNEENQKELKSELINLLGKNLFESIYDIVEKNTPTEYFMFEEEKLKKLITDKLLDDFKQDKISIAILRILDIYKLIFAEREKNMLV